jgi:Relaxase/Mobilisation nuclease domain
VIGKIRVGTSFKRLLHYLHEKEKARLIDGNMAGENPRELLAEFRSARALNPNLSRSVCHVSLSLPLHERLNDERWRAIAADFIQGMDFNGSQYVIYRHHDQEHDHIHIALCRIRLTDGTTVSDRWDFRRAEALIRKLEKQYQLEPVQSSWEKLESSPTTGEIRRSETTGMIPVRTRLQRHITQATQKPLTMPQLISFLKKQGINVRLRESRAGITGISYELDGMAFSGSKLGAAYSFPGLQKYKGVGYDSNLDRDETWLAAIQLIQHPEPETNAVPSRQDLAQEGDSTTEHRVGENLPMPVVEPSKDYQQMWQKYSQGVQANNQVRLDFLVTQKALKDGQTAKNAVKMLDYSPFVQEMVAKGKDVKMLQDYIQQTVRQAGQEPQHQQVRQKKKKTLELGM